MEGFEKISFSTDSVEDLKRKLRVGDILYTRPRDPKGFSRAFYEMSRRVQGTPYTHVGLYVGDGEVVDAGSWKPRGKDEKPRTGIHKVPLRDFTGRYDFKVLRPKVPDGERQEAANYAKRQLGKKYNTKGMLRVALPGKKTKAKSRERKELAESFFCSELIANAYHDDNLASRRKLRHVLPGDLHKSTKTKTVGSYNKEKTAKFPKTETCKYCQEQATDRAIWAEGNAYVPVCSDHRGRVEREMKGKGDEVHKFTKIAEVQAYQQDTEWTCSAACLKAVLLHHGIDVSEEECVEAIGARPDRGAETTDIMNAAKSMGLHAEEGSFSGWHSVAKYLAEGLPIIADVQSFNYPGKGHYIVITGLHSDGVIAMDPNTKGKTVVDNWRIIPYDEMEWRWFDRAMEPPHNPMPKWGVVVFPPEPSEEGLEKEARGLGALIGAGTGAAVGGASLAKTKAEKKTGRKSGTGNPVVGGIVGAALGGLAGDIASATREVAGRRGVLGSALGMGIGVPLAGYFTYQDALEDTRKGIRGRTERFGKEVAEREARDKALRKALWSGLAVAPLASIAGGASGALFDDLRPIPTRVSMDDVASSSSRSSGPRIPSELDRPSVTVVRSPRSQRPQTEIPRGFRRSSVGSQSQAPQNQAQAPEPLELPRMTEDQARQARFRNVRDEISRPNRRPSSDSRGNTDSEDRFRNVMDEIARDGKKKTANGDMLEYFSKNPQKHKEYLERKKAKERRKKAKLKTANDPIKERRKVQGIPVSVEWRKGETRRYYNHDPLKKSSKGTIDYNKKMKAHYGYIPGTKDADGEQLDVYVGPNEKSDKIFVLEKKRATDGNFDEYKVMLGYDSKEEAKKSYLAHQGKDELGSIREMSRAQFDKFLSSRKVKTAQVQGLLYELEKIGASKSPMVEGARIGVLLGAILGSVQGAADDESSQLGKAVQYGAAGAPIGALAMHLAKSKLGR